MARSFNHIGPGQSDRFVDLAISRTSLARDPAPAGAMPVVAVGDIDVTRDFTDVRDVVRAYFALLETARPGRSTTSARAWSVPFASLLGRLMELSGVTARVAPQSGAPAPRGTAPRAPAIRRKFMRRPGWTAATPLDESLAAMLDYWKNDDNATWLNRH